MKGHQFFKISIFLVLLIILLATACDVNNVTDGGGSSGGGGSSSHDSSEDNNPGNPEDNAIKNLIVRELENVSEIDIDWQAVTGFDLLNDSYKIYRYKPSLDNQSLQLDAVYENIKNNFFTDTEALIENPYFYKVTYIKNGIESSENEDYEFGVFTNIIDEYEDKKSIADIEGDDVGTFPVLNDGLKTAVIYSCKNGDDGLIKDTDYYKYKGIVDEVISFKVQLNETVTSFDTNGDIRFRYYYKDINGDLIEGPEHQYIKGSPGNEIQFDVIGVNDVYFKVYIDADYSNQNIIEKYQVSLSKGL